MKAVIWTDVIQIIAMLTAMVLMVSKGTIDVGGCTIVWIRSWESGRLEGPRLGYAFYADCITNKCICFTVLT